MKLKYFYSIILLLMQMGIFSQSKKEIMRFSYDMVKGYHELEVCKTKSVPFEPEKIFRKSKYSLDTLKEVASFFKQHASLAINKNSEGEMVIKVESRFPSYFHDEIFGLVKFKYVSADVFNSKKETIKFKKTNSISFGGKIKEGSNSEFEYQTIENSLRVENKDIQVSGNVKHELSILTNYSIIKINVNEIGRIIELNKLKYQIVRIEKNKVVLKRMFVSDYQDGIKMLLFDTNQKLILHNDGNQNLNSVNWIGRMSSNYYNFIYQNANLSFDEFKNKVSYEDIITNKPEYIIISGLANIEGEFILYEPEYDVVCLIESLVK